jgi:hypothetical protein
VLAGGCLSIIVVVTAFLAKNMFDSRAGAGAYLFIAIVVIAMAAASGWWLKRLVAQTTGARG